MTPNEFVTQVRESIVNDNLSIYKETFASTALQSATDPHWIRALTFYAKLEQDERNVVLDIMRQVMVDTVSHVFAVLDGVSRLAGQQGDFDLRVNAQTECLNGELQDRFLELEENS